VSRLRNGRGSTSKKGEDRRRSVTRVNTVSVDGFDIIVCKKVFLSLHSISDGRLSRMLHKKCQLTNPSTDHRGKHNARPNKVDDASANIVRDHINKIPRRQSHYSREDNPNRRYQSPELKVNILYCMYKDRSRIGLR
jgi:hypothetical protein